ncbi:MAG: hypothetical protein JW715_10715 [Sedimentisphaerales bacterium]|nr:hypothetical protein [Sedimentisphaerales bacterium]
MDTKKKIEQSLKAAPKPPAPDGLFNKLQVDIAFTESMQSDNIIHRFFAPAGGPISLWRVAAAILIASVILLPLTYAGGKIIKSYFVEVEVIETIETEDGGIVKVGTATAIAVESSGQPNEQEAKEIQELRKAGKFEKVLVEERVENGMKFSLYKVTYTLSNGKVITVTEVSGSSIQD